MHSFDMEGGFNWATSKSTMRLISKYLADHAGDYSGFAEFLEPDVQEMYDAQGAWYAGNFSLPDMLKLKDVLERMANDIPNSMSTCRPEWLPFYCDQLSSIRAKLDERIEQLRAAGGADGMAGGSPSSGTA